MKIKDFFFLRHIATTINTFNNVRHFRSCDKYVQIFQIFYGNAAPDYLTVQNRKIHEVNDFIQILSIETLFFRVLTYTV